MHQAEQATGKTHMTQGNLDADRTMEGIRQLQKTEDLDKLIKCDAGVHLLGSKVLSFFKQDTERYMQLLEQDLNRCVQRADRTFHAGLVVDESSHTILETFARDRNVRLVRSGWLELREMEAVSTHLLYGIYLLANGRLSVGIFRVF